MSNLQFVIIFIGIVLALSFMDNYSNFIFPNDNKKIAKQLNLVDNDKFQEATKTEDGKQVEKCYSTPYKLIKTQYGDRGLLAGYNEYVEAYTQGGINQPSPDGQDFNDKC